MMYNYTDILVQLETNEIGYVDESNTILSSIDELLKHPVWIKENKEQDCESHTCGMIRKIISYEVE